MPSSISSSKPAASPGAALILLATALVIALVAIVRPPSRAPADPSWFWREKVAWRAEAALVLAGDSRVYRGLSPAVFEARGLGPARNFGFSGAALDPAYLDAIEALVDPSAGAPIILLGVSPWSLTPRAAAANGFLTARAEALATPLPARWSRRMEGLAARFKPFSLVAPTSAVAQTDSKGYLQTFHPDGWVESRHLSPDPARALAVAREDHARGNRVDSASVRALAERIVQWRRRGWRVFAVFIPGEPAADRLAAELSGWNEAGVPAALAAAGAIWLEPRVEPLFSYDGVHLDGESAQRFSAALAEAVGAAE
jgi:hypothetical protein